MVVVAASTLLVRDELDVRVELRVEDCLHISSVQVTELSVARQAAVHVVHFWPQIPPTAESITGAWSLDQIGQGGEAVRT